MWWSAGNILVKNAFSFRLRVLGRNTPQLELELKAD